MYWRAGGSKAVLWIVCLTLVLSGFAALLVAGSSSAALAFLATGAVFAPPVQEQIARFRHPMAPAKAAFFATITLVPIGLGFLVIDGLATTEREAKRRGFASAADWGRARDLGLPTAAALAARDKAVRKAALDKLCANQHERPLLQCFEAGHQRAALAFVDRQMAGNALAAVVRDAIGRQRKAYLAADKDCAELLARIDQDALPEILEKRPQVIAIAAGMWARRLTEAELDDLVRRGGPGVTRSTTSDQTGLDRKIAVAAPAVERELEAALQTWARQIVLSEPDWRSLLKGRVPMSGCKPAHDGIAAGSVGDGRGG